MISVYIPCHIGAPVHVYGCHKLDPYTNKFKYVLEKQRVCRITITPVDNYLATWISAYICDVDVYAYLSKYCRYTFDKNKLNPKFPILFEKPEPDHGVSYFRYVELKITKKTYNAILLSRLEL